MGTSGRRKRRGDCGKIGKIVRDAATLSEMWGHCQEAGDVHRGGGGGHCEGVGTLSKGRGGCQKGGEVVRRAGMLSGRQLVHYDVRHCYNL